MNCFSVNLVVISSVWIFLPPQTLQFDRSQLAAVTEENEGLRKQVEQLEGEAKKWVICCIRSCGSLNDSHSNDLDHDAYLCCQVLFINTNRKHFLYNSSSPRRHMSQYMWCGKYIHSITHCVICTCRLNVILKNTVCHILRSYLCIYCLL